MSGSKMGTLDTDNFKLKYFLDFGCNFRIIGKMDFFDQYIDFLSSCMDYK